MRGLRRVGINGSDKDIGPWAMPKYVEEHKDKLVLVRQVGYQTKDESWSQQVGDIVRGDKPPQKVEWKPKARPPNEH